MGFHPSLKGIWQSVGYGWLLDIGSDRYRLLHTSEVCLVEAESGIGEDFQTSFDRVERRDNTLSLHNLGDITRYDFERIDALPPLPVYRAGEHREPFCNFDYLWQQFRDHYAFFELRGVDWEALRAEYRPRLRDGMLDRHLLYVFERMLKPFNDGHVSLKGGFQTVKSCGEPTLQYAMQEAFDLIGPVLGRNSVAAIATGIGDALLAPLNVHQDAIRTACNHNLLWCEIRPGIGYLCVLRLHDFSDGERLRGIPQNKQSLGNYLEQDIAVLDKALDEIFSDLQTMRTVIVDLRINAGGFDRASQLIAGRFADQRRLAWQKRASCPGGLTPRQKQFVTPAKPGFSGPTWVLTSPLCVSAGEILTLCMRALPRVTTVGESTAGILSDNLIKSLPNGWELSLSNEIYEDHEGRCFEAVGIPAARPLKVTDSERFVETARESLQRLVADIT